MQSIFKIAKPYIYEKQSYQLQESVCIQFFVFSLTEFKIAFSSYLGQLPSPQTFQWSYIIYHSLYHVCTILSSPWQTPDLFSWFI